jgi:hypothetical protein
LFQLSAQSKSWVRREKESEDLLKKEQIYFDLEELFARKIKKKASETTFDSATAQDEFNKLCSAFRKECRSRVKMYDTETASSPDDKIELEWEKKIEEELEDLVAFNKATIRVPLR